MNSSRLIYIQMKKQLNHSCSDGEKGVGVVCVSFVVRPSLIQDKWSLRVTVHISP